MLIIHSCNKLGDAPTGVNVWLVDSMNVNINAQVQRKMMMSN